MIFIDLILIKHCIVMNVLLGFLMLSSRAFFKKRDLLLGCSSPPDPALIVPPPF